jgi:hypothetical protein
VHGVFRTFRPAFFITFFSYGNHRHPTATFAIIPRPINIDNAESIPSFHVYLPQLEDAASIQSAISEVCEMMLHRRIEPKEASALFYAIQVASSNLVHKNQKPNSETSSDTSSPPPASSEPNHLPPGTIKACEQPRRRNRRLRA